VCIGSVWPRIDTGGELLWTCNEPCFDEMLGNFWVAAQLVASQVVLSSTELGTVMSPQKMSFMFSLLFVWQWPWAIILLFFDFSLLCWMVIGKQLAHDLITNQSQSQTRFMTNSESAWLSGVSSAFANARLPLYGSVIWRGHNLPFSTLQCNMAMCCQI
jgi:hypothetical protein